MMEEVKKNMLQKEEFLSQYACRSVEAIRFKEQEEDFRPAFFRDIDKIIYSLSYTRYLDKTQVFSETDNDNISKRMTHVQMVSKIARTIGRALSLNEDLIEAIALGHDIGHVPFGHVGEAILNKISVEANEGYFNHNVQSVRILMELENAGRGRNLSVQVLDGILCHNGEFLEGEYCPQKKTKEEFLQEYQECYHDKKVLSHLHPMTLEGCVVRISDIIGYIGRDLEDAYRMGVLRKEDLPEDIVQVLGNKNTDIINHIVLDIIQNSYGKDAIILSKEMYNMLIKMKKFNYEHIYDKATTLEQRKQYENMFRTLFSIYVEQIEKECIDEKIYTVFLNYKCKEYRNHTTTQRKVIDYIAGMTDDYFLHEYERLCKKDI